MKKLGTFYGNHSHQGKSVSQISLDSERKGKRFQPFLLFF
jgi:hypothetical protein